jgi:hypothetical protein
MYRDMFSLQNPPPPRHSPLVEVKWLDQGISQSSAAKRHPLLEISVARLVFIRGLQHISIYLLLVIRKIKLPIFIYSFMLTLISRPNNAKGCAKQRKIGLDIFMSECTKVR